MANLLGCVKSWMLSDIVLRQSLYNHSTWLPMSQSFTLESNELLRQPKLQKGEKKTKKTFLVGELRRQSPIDWRVYRAQFPKLERSQNTKLFSSFYSKDQFAICWWSHLNSYICTIKSSTFELPQLQVLQKKLGNIGKTKHHCTKMEFAGLADMAPIIGVFFRPQTFWLSDVIVCCTNFLHNPFVFCTHRSFNRPSQKR